MEAIIHLASRDQLLNVAFAGDDVDDMSHLTSTEREELVVSTRQEEMRKAYTATKNAITGSIITCPVCGKRYVKTTYHKVFDKTKCRERYWNFADEERWKRTQLC